MLSTVPRRVAWFIIGITAGLLVIATVGMIAAGLALSQDNGRVLAIVQDCIEPGGECYQEGADRVNLINRVSVLAAACADDPQRQTALEIEACVRDALQGGSA